MVKIFAKEDISPILINRISNSFESQSLSIFKNERLAFLEQVLSEIPVKTPVKTLTRVQRRKEKRNEKRKKKKTCYQLKFIVRKKRLIWFRYKKRKKRSISLIKKRALLSKRHLKMTALDILTIKASYREPSNQHTQVGYTKKGRGSFTSFNQKGQLSRSGYPQKGNPLYVPKTENFKGNTVNKASTSRGSYLRKYKKKGPFASKNLKKERFAVEDPRRIPSSIKQDKLREAKVLSKKSKSKYV